MNLATDTWNYTDINIHPKTEASLKDEPYWKWEDEVPRQITWQDYYVTAMYSPIFIEAKKRLKMLLKEDVLYTDGLTPTELAGYLRNFKDVDGFFENDLEKQDR